MANFNIALRETLLNEGIWKGKTPDGDAETCYGINREKHPETESPLLEEYWGIVDETRSRSDIISIQDMKESLFYNERLTDLRELFYKTKFWTKIRGKEIGAQGLANFLFDAAVNHGHRTVVKWLQEGLNMLLECNLEKDGIFGNLTMEKYKEILRTSSVRPWNKFTALCVHLSGCRWHHNYIWIAEKPTLRLPLYSGLIKRCRIEW